MYWTKLETVLNRYGLGCYDVRTNDILEGLLEAIYTVKEVHSNCSGSELKRLIMNALVYEAGNIHIINKNKFKSFLSAEGIDTSIEDWKLDFFWLENFRSSNGSKLVFEVVIEDFRESIVNNQLNRNKEHFRERYPLFCVEYLFQQKGALNGLYAEIDQELNSFISDASKAIFMQKMQQELAILLDKIYEEVKKEYVEKQKKGMKKRNQRMLRGEY